MTDFCNSPSKDDDREGKADAPAIAVKRLIRRLPRALLDWLKAPRDRRRLSQLHRFNEHMLKDVGLSQRESEHEVRQIFTAQRDLE